MKRTTQILLLLTLLLSVSKINAQEPYFIHTVSKGQTLYSISRMYQTTVKEIIDLNPECIEKISVGQKIKIRQQLFDKNTTQKEDSVIYHTIKQGETLYRLGKQYNISPQEICAANPGLNIANFRSGEVIMIPLRKKVEARPAPTANVRKEETNTYPDTIPIRTIHKVKKGETVYNVSRKYEITEEELRAVNPEIKKNKLKKNSLIRIPYSKQDIDKLRKQKYAQNASPQSNAEIFETVKQSKDSANNDNFAGIRVAVILPFMLDSYAPNEQGRMVEYYEGFLMAVEELKEQGYSFEINTFDSGNANNSLEPLLASGELDNMDLIIGALYPAHNKQLADFAKNKEIPLVIPFTSKEDEIFRNPMVYVVNTMQSYFYSEVIDHFTVQFPNANVIFVSDSIDNKKEFVTALTEGLDTRMVPHSTITLSQLIDGENNEATLKEIMKEGMDNVFIPTSSSEVTLGTMLPSLILLNNDIIDLPDFKLFGYPEWQIYAGNMRSQIYEVNTYFYASFFSHYTLPESSRFQNEYIRWYNRAPQNIYPRYGMLGYDTGYTFLLAMSKYGNNMASKINSLSFKPVQTGFKFQRVNNWGGMINKKIYFINYTPTFDIIKIDFDKI
ncbi:MAG: LysM peptidoglycan-binding domain-containing protein [Bacteroidaceae bacterium]|nr:LysM peptidoglycan-binding domain-containing protein [Bacteroidaceae bacterium]